MATEANITSVDALDQLRSSLVIFVDKAKRALDEVSDQVRRTRVWVEHDQRIHYEGMVRRRTKELERAQEELFSARIGTFKRATTEHEMAVARAKRNLEEAHRKLKILKKWGRDYETVVEPVAKRLERMRDILVKDLPEGIAFLSKTQRTLAAYAETTPALEEPASRPPEGAADAEEEPTAESAHSTDSTPNP